jgi:protein SCO1/2
MSWLALLLIAAGTLGSSQSPLPVHDGVGGDFVAQSSLGRDVSLAEFRGKVVLILFGYTSCPDFCPTALSHLRALMKRIGESADAVQVLFVTVDPEIDSADHLKQYLAQFDARFIGLTGGRDAVDRIAKLFRVKHQKSHDVKLPTKYSRSRTFVEEAYLYTHSQQIYLLDKAGRTRALFFTGSPLEEMKQAVLGLLREPSVKESTATRQQAPAGAGRKSR